MTRLLSHAALAALLGVATADCPNGCSGHGLCNNIYDMCQCYRRWSGADCSERVCQYDRAFVDSGNGDLNFDGLLGTTGVTGEVALGSGVPQEQRGHSWNEFERLPHDEYSQSRSNAMGFSQNEGHHYVECSNKGLCDRKTGKCACFPGYEGAGCHRMACPGTDEDGAVCSGHGTCEYIKDIVTTYNLWDKDAARICACDPGWQGANCAQRMCPHGDDPLYTNTTGSEVQAFYMSCSTAGTNGVEGSFKLEYTDVFGEKWSTTNITLASDTNAVTALAAKVVTALEGIPNGVLKSVAVTASAPNTKDVLLSVTFTGNPGDLHLMSSDVRGVYCDVDTARLLDDGSDIASHYKTLSGGYTNTECSNRGQCDYETGLCGCFKGYTGDDCATQDALSM